MNILVYGDSLAYGLVPVERRRYGVGERWPSVMQVALGEKYSVVEEGLRSRMMDGDNPFYRERNGLKQFGPILASHLPLDLVIIMLGTNDSMEEVGKEPVEIAASLYDYVNDTEEWALECHYETPKLLIVAPPQVNEKAANKGSRKRFTNAGRKMKNLPSAYRQVAQDVKAFFYDASYIVPSDKDGIHLDRVANEQLGKDLASFILSDI